MSKKRVLFLCTNNSARSQLAEAILNKLYPEKYEAFSAGTEPTRVNPDAITVLREADIPTDKLYSKSLEVFLDQDFDYAITLCDNAQKTCPFFPGAKNQLHKPFKDPARAKGSEAEILSAFRKTRDEIKQWIEDFFGKKLV